MPAMTSSFGTLLVKVMVALRVWGLASLPMASSPCSMIHSVVSSRSALFANVSLPSMDRPPSAGGLTSRTTFLSLPMVTLSPATGTLRFGQVSGSDQFVGWPPAIRSLSLSDSEHAAEQECRNERHKKDRAILLLMTSTPILEDDPILWRQSIARLPASARQATSSFE